MRKRLQKGIFFVIAIFKKTDIYVEITSYVLPMFYQTRIIAGQGHDMIREVKSMLATTLLSDRKLVLSLVRTHKNYKSKPL